jgi:predicted peptidase
MRKTHLSAAVCIALGLAVFAEPSRTIADESGQKSCQLERTIKVSMKYLLYLPKDYEAKESVPLMLFLHGIGERGDDLELVKHHGPPKLIEEGQAFPCIVVSPQCPKDRSWETFEMSALLDEIVEKYK